MKCFNDSLIPNEIELIKAKEIVEKKVKELRLVTPNLVFPHDKLAELEINKFFYIQKLLIV